MWTWQASMVVSRSTTWSYFTNKEKIKIYTVFISSLLQIICKKDNQKLFFSKCVFKMSKVFNFTTCTNNSCKCKKIFKGEIWPWSPWCPRKWSSRERGTWPHLVWCCLLPVTVITKSHQNHGPTRNLLQHPPPQFQKHLIPLKSSLLL